MSPLGYSGQPWGHGVQMQPRPSFCMHRHSAAPGCTLQNTRPVSWHWFSQVPPSSDI